MNEKTIATKPFVGMLFLAVREIGAPLDTREPRGVYAHCRSIGLVTPRAPRFITCRYLIVVPDVSMAE
jgi:hypothetical protein